VKANRFAGNKRRPRMPWVCTGCGALLGRERAWHLPCGGSAPCVHVDSLSRAATGIDRASGSDAEPDCG